MSRTESSKESAASFENWNLSTQFSPPVYDYLLAYYESPRQVMLSGPTFPAHHQTVYRDCRHHQALECGTITPRKWYDVMMVK